MADEQLRIELLPDPDLAFSFRFIERSTGNELTAEEVKTYYQPPQHMPRRFARDSAGTAVRLCGEGDSWINLLWPISGYPKTFFDILGDRYRTRNIAFPGDTLEEIVGEKQYRAPLKSGIYRAFIFSGGGNDVVGGGALRRLLKSKADGGGSNDPNDYVHASRVAASLAGIKRRYRRVAREVAVWAPESIMLTHGYDYVIPRRNGRSLGRPLESKGFAHNDPIARKIIAYLVDRLHDTLTTVARDNAHVRHVNLRGVVKGRWHDELHPKQSASIAIADKFDGEIKRLLTS